MAHLTDEQRVQFNHRGYVVVEDVLDPERDLAPVTAEYEGVLDWLATQMYESDMISATYQHLPFFERLTRIYAESGKMHTQYFDITLPQRGITHDTPLWTGPAVFQLLRRDGLLDAIESVIGPEIYSNPVQHVRLKPPERLLSGAEQLTAGRAHSTATPWHQDNGVITSDADETEMITVWIPLVDTTQEMGCLVVVPGSHNKGLLTHCPRTGSGRLHVPKKLFQPADGLPVPMRCGSALFMHRRTLHSSLPNNSAHIRWSFDLRYQPIGQPTGRSAFPGFIARSSARPETELRDPSAWTASWLKARCSLAERTQPPFNRWDPNAAACA